MIIKRKLWTSIGVGLTALALVATACGSSDTSGTSATVTTTETTPLFGDREWPCGPGNASGATDQGVTDTEIIIGGGDDRGFQAVRGLNQEMTQAVEDFVEECNRLGGINGRKVKHINYDAAIFNAAAVIREACGSVFMLVGSGFSLDVAAEPDRVNCNLAAVPAWAVSADFSHGPDQVTAVPNPADQLPLSQAAIFAKGLVPGFENIDRTKSAGLYGNYPATADTWAKVKAAYSQHFDYEFVVDKPYTITGEDDWTPWTKVLKDNNVEFIYFTGTCLPHYQALRANAVTQELPTNIAWTTDSNFYEGKCAAANTDGAMDRTFIRMAFLPFEEAEYSPATKRFIEIVEGAGHETSLLGMQAVSSFLLWATAAKKCGSELTRACVINELRNVNSWTGHGLHVETDPAGNQTSNCGLLLEIRGTEYVRVWPKELGTYACPSDPEFNATTWRGVVETEALKAAKLDENRISTKHR